MKDITIQHKTIGKGHPVFIIAEAGVNHNGDVKLAKKLIDAAVEVGVDCVKFQTFKAEDLVTKDADMATYQKQNLGVEESQFAMLKKLELNYEDFSILQQYCEQKGIIFMSTPHTEPAVDILDPIVPAYKIGSGDLTNIPLLIKVAKTGKPILISSGMGTMDEVKEAVKTLKEAGNDQIVMYHCTTNYPCPFEEVNLRAMLTMQNEIDCLIGYSDHTPGISVPVMATALGAVSIEKHFTLDKSMDGPDHKASLNPEEFAALVREVRHAEQALGSKEKKPNPSEIKIMQVARKSVVAKRDIPAGKAIEVSDLTIKRPASGLHPKLFYQLIGKRALRNISEDTLIVPEDIDDWAYQETSQKLSSRIDIHDTQSEKDIDAWMLSILDLKGSEQILDIGCGTGKQVVAYGKLSKNFGIHGCDISEDLLSQAKNTVAEQCIQANLFIQDMNQDFNFTSGSFDLISACFSIYYVRDASNLMRELHRLLKPGGKLFIAGPSPQNSKEFWDLHEKLSEKPIPQACLMRRDRIHNEFIPLAKELFTKVDINNFENTITFADVDSLMEYYEASLLFKETVDSEAEKQQLLWRMRQEAMSVIQKQGDYKMKKVVYGVLATKGDDLA